MDVLFLGFSLVVVFVLAVPPIAASAVAAEVRASKIAIEVAVPALFAKRSRSHRGVPPMRDPAEIQAPLQNGETGEGAIPAHGAYSQGRTALPARVGAVRATKAFARRHIVLVHANRVEDECAHPSSEGGPKCFHSIRFNQKLRLIGSRGETAARSAQEI
jgi:hypothetical protein